MLASFFFSRNPTLIIFGINRKMIQIPKNMVRTICRYPHREAAGMEEARLWRSEMAANISVYRTLLELPMLHFPKFKNCCEALARVVPIFSSRLTAVHHHRTTTT